MEEREPQISTPTAILIGIVTVIADVVDILVAGSGIPIGDIIAFPVTQIYLIIKGLKGTQMLAGNLIELIPGIDAIPIRTATWVFVVWADRHPKVEEALEVVAAIKGTPKTPAAGVSEKITGTHAPQTSVPQESAGVERRIGAQEVASEEQIAKKTQGETGHRPPGSKTQKGGEGTTEETPDTAELSTEETPQYASQEENALEELGWGTETRRIIETLEKTPGLQDIERRGLKKEPRIRLHEDKNTIDLKNVQ